MPRGLECNFGFILKSAELRRDGGISRFYIKRRQNHGLDSSESERGKLAGLREFENEDSGSKKGGDFD